MTPVWRAVVIAALAAACASTRVESEGLREVVTLEEGDQVWVDGEGLSVFLHSVDPTLELATVYLKPRGMEEEQTFTMGPGTNRVVDYEDWRLELLELPGPDSATLAIQRIRG